MSPPYEARGESGPPSRRVLLGVFLQWFFQDKLHWIEAKPPVSGECRCVACKRMNAEPSGSLIFQMCFNGFQKLQGNILAAPPVQYENI